MDRRLDHGQGGSFRTGLLNQSGENRGRRTKGVNSMIGLYSTVSVTVLLRATALYRTNRSTHGHDEKSQSPSSKKPATLQGARGVVNLEKRKLDWRRCKCQRKWTRIFVFDYLKFGHVFFIVTTTLASLPLPMPCLFRSREKAPTMTRVSAPFRRLVVGFTPQTPLSGERL